LFSVLEKRFLKLTLFKALTHVSGAKASNEIKDLPLFFKFFYKHAKASFIVLYTAGVIASALLLANT